MFSIRTVLLVLAGIFSASIGCTAAETNASVSSAPVYVPDTTHANDPLPDGIIAWSSLLESADATNEQESVHFTFTFTNITSGNVTVLNVHPSCGCTTAELPPVPWMLPAGSDGKINLTVNLQGKSGTLFKQVTVSTDKGTKNLMLRINILPPPPMAEMTEEQRAAGMAAAKADRQAVFKGDCASCHLKKIEGKYGQQLYDAICAICHESAHRATMVPDLHNLQVPTNEEFWRTWITAGKAGSLMPAFATSQGGPLSDLQIASLAAYLNAVCPSRATNAPATK
jgi:mono/diheme cytochrome c family protein